MWVWFAGVSASSSSSGVISVGHMGNYGYGSVIMEKSFRVSIYRSPKIYDEIGLLSY